MIPNAATLAAILNDPTVPSEAKPDWMRRRSHTAVHVEDQEGDYLKVVDKRGYSVFSLYHKEAHHALFWSMSAWLWGRGICPWIDESIHTGYFAAEYRGDDIGPHAWPTKPTPVEALAAVVREVAQTR